MNLTASDIDTITMYRFEPVRGSEDYKCGMERVELYSCSKECERVMIHSNHVMRNFCDRMKKAPI